jgi:tetratricopeptide (TPR) repeat protein
MIGGVPEPEEKSSSGAAGESPSAREGEVQKPLVLLPVSPQDFARRKRRARFALVLVLVLVAAGVAWIYRRSTDPLRARQAYDAGERLYRIARYSEAILSFDSAIAIQPNFAEAYLLRGRSRRGVNDLERAIADFSQVVRLRPNSSDAYVDRGLAYLETKNYTQAINDSNHALEIDPKLAAAYNLRATVERAQGDLNKALADFTRALELYPDLDNYYQRGATYQLMGEHQKAIKDFDEAVAFSPYSAQAYFARAESKRAIGDEQGARRDHLQGRILDGR